MLVVIGLQGVAKAQLPTFENCGSMQNAYGPYDYTNIQHRRLKLPIVEAGHFNSNVENLIQGQSGKIVDDLEYTLRAFPNHPRALWAMARLHIREGMNKLPGGLYSIECWFDRALRMNPEDPTTRYIFGMYQHKVSDYQGALKNYQIALSLRDGQAEIHYNLGLLYLELDDIEAARTQAIEAYRLGYPLPGLNRKLKDKGIDLDADLRED
jgi:tetratricopeptide (TPR) repeat protein